MLGFQCNITKIFLPVYFALMQGKSTEEYTHLLNFYNTQTMKWAKKELIIKRVK